MKLGLAKDRGRKLASTATPNNPDGSKYSSLRSAGNIRIKNEDGEGGLKKGYFYPPQLLFTQFCNSGKTKTIKEVSAIS